MSDEEERSGDRSRMAEGIDIIIDEAKTATKRAYKKSGAEDLSGSIKETLRGALSPRDNVVMVRLNDESLAKLDELVEAGIVNSRSEAAAFLIGEGAAADVQAWLLEWTATTFGNDSTQYRTVAGLFVGSNAAAVTTGIALTLYAASRGFVAVVRALDVVYDDEHRRRWLSTRVVGFAITIVTVVVFALTTVMIVIGPLLGSGDDVAERIGRGSWFATAWVWLRFPLTFLIVVAWTASVYRFAPRRRSSWRRELPGAVVATLWWLVASTVFRVYLGVASGGMNTVFGLLGGALSLLFWLYLLAMGLLVGAVVNGLIAHRRELTTAVPGQD